MAVVDSMVEPKRHGVAIVFSCLEGKTLARLLLMLGECPGGSVPVRPAPVDVVEVGRMGETPSLAPAFLWTTCWTKWIHWVRPLRSVPAVAYS